MGRSMTSSVIRAEFYKLVQYYAERGWLVVERQDGPLLQVRLVYRAALNRRRSAPFADQGDERIITVTEAGEVRVERDTVE